MLLEAIAAAAAPYLRSMTQLVSINHELNVVYHLKATLTNAREMPHRVVSFMC